MCFPRQAGRCAIGLAGDEDGNRPTCGNPLWGANFFPVQAVEHS